MDLKRREREYEGVKKQSLETLGKGGDGLVVVKNADEGAGMERIMSWLRREELSFIIIIIIKIGMEWRRSSVLFLCGGNQKDGDFWCWWVADWWLAVTESSAGFGGYGRIPILCRLPLSQNL